MPRSPRLGAAGLLTIVASSIGVVLLLIVTLGPYLAHRAMLMRLRDDTLTYGELDDLMEFSFPGTYDRLTPMAWAAALIAGTALVVWLTRVRYQLGPAGRRAVWGWCLTMAAVLISDGHRRLAEQAARMALVEGNTSAAVLLYIRPGDAARVDAATRGRYLAFFDHAVPWASALPVLVPWVVAGVTTIGLVLFCVRQRGLDPDIV